MIMKKLISILIAVFMLAAVAVPAFAADETVTVTFSVSGGTAPVMKHEMTVNAGTAAKYGFKTASADHNGVKIEGVTVFDVIAAANAELYGEAFSDKPTDYLVISSGFLTKAFSQSASSSGFIVNDIVPNDGIYNPDYYGYTGYACDTARVENGDDITFYFYRDTKYWSDNYAWFDSDIYTADRGENITVTLNGYCAAYYGINDLQTILDNYAAPMEGIGVYTEINGEKMLLGTTDARGNAVISFPEAGKYVIFAEGNTPDESPVITAYADVTITAEQPADEKPHTFIEWIRHILSVIKEWFSRLFSVFNG